MTRIRGGLGLLPLLLLTVACTSHGHLLLERWGLERTLPCTIGEVFCGLECKSVDLCLADNVIFPIDICADTEKCDASTMMCSSKPSVCKTRPDDELFRCHGKGFFPNPFDCHSYFDCNPAGGGTAAPEKGLKVLCDPISTAYDPLSTTCRLTETARVCTEGPIPKCLAGAQNGPQKENPNIYYVCVNDPSSNSLVPWLFRCDNALDDYVDGKCKPRDATETPTTPNTLTPTTPVTPTTTSPTNPTVCTAPGTSVPDPLDCHSYYFCTMNMEPIHYTCQQGYYFDKIKGYCVKGTCNNL